MALAPLSFLRFGELQHRVPRWQENSIVFSDNQDQTFKIEYYKIPPSEFFSSQVYPAPKDCGVSATSRWVPPPHYHLLQDEHFKVESGAGIWHLYGGKNVRVNKGETISIKARRYHWFEPAPDIDEPLAVLYRYDKEYQAMEESFFRNQFAYMEDCKKQGLEMSMFQTMVFCMHNWMPLAVWERRFLPEWLNLIISSILMLIMGFIGQYLLGYRASYEEYYLERGDKKQ